MTVFYWARSRPNSVIKASKVALLLVRCVQGPALELGNEKIVVRGEAFALVFVAGLWLMWALSRLSSPKRTAWARQSLSRARICSQMIHSWHISIFPIGTNAKSKWSLLFTCRNSCLHQIVINCTVQAILSVGKSTHTLYFSTLALPEVLAQLF